MIIIRVGSTNEIVGNIDAAYRYTGKHGIYDAHDILGEILGNYYNEKAVIAKSSNQLVGIALYRVYPNELHILEFAVVRQRLGIGTRILRELTDIAKEGNIHSVTVSYGPGSKGFYDKLGFVQNYEDLAGNPTALIKRV